MEILEQIQNIRKELETILIGQNDLAKITTLGLIFGKVGKPCVIMLDSSPGEGKSYFSKALGRLLNLKSEYFLISQETKVSELFPTSIIEKNGNGEKEMFENPRKDTALFSSDIAILDESLQAKGRLRDALNDYRADGISAKSIKEIQTPVRLIVECNNIGDGEIALPNRLADLDRYTFSFKLNAIAKNAVHVNDYSILSQLMFFRNDKAFSAICDFDSIAPEIEKEIEKRIKEVEKFGEVISFFLSEIHDRVKVLSSRRVQKIPRAIACYSMAEGRECVKAQDLEVLGHIFSILVDDEKYLKETVDSCISKAFDSGLDMEKKPIVFKLNSVNQSSIQERINQALESIKRGEGSKIYLTKSLLKGRGWLNNLIETNKGILTFDKRAIKGLDVKEI